MSVEIDGKRYGWQAPICERDWCLQHGGETGPWQQPVRVRFHTTEQCAFCGFPTWAGIFVRADPTTVPYPKEETDDD